MLGINMSSYEPDPVNKFPSTAHLDEKGRYIPCPLNQSQAIKLDEARLHPPSIGQLEYPPVEKP